LDGPGLGRGCWLAIVVTVAVVALGAFAVYRLAVPGGTRSSDLPPMAAKYQQIAETTLHRCDPSSDSAAYSRCTGGFGSAIGTVTFPDSATADIDAMKLEVKLAVGCSAKTNHDNPNLREWDVGCPQQDGGTADPTAAATRDLTALRDIQRDLLRTDTTLHRDLGGPNPSPGDIP